MINGTASVTALLLGTLASALMQQPRIQSSTDPAATAFMLLLLFWVNVNYWAREMHKHVDTTYIWALS